MKSLLALTLALAFVHTSNVPRTESHSRKPVVLVHFVAINMSGTAREIHHDKDVVVLPVAERVPLQVPAGNSIEVTSHADRKVEEVINITAADEGRTIPIH